MLQRALLIAFFRGVGGGLSLAAVPYLLAFGGWTLKAGAGGFRGLRGMAADMKDAKEYYEELRKHRRSPNADLYLDGHHPDTGLDNGAN